MSDIAKASERPRILLIDDDENLLKALVRLHGRKFELTPISRPVEAIQVVQSSGPFAAVFCDYQMPGLKGAACLAKIQAIAPDTVRVLLTGNNDLATAIDAINRGAVFRFLNKPCDEETFERCANDAVRQYQLLKGERDLLENTLRGAVQVMSEILSMTNPKAFGRAGRVHGIVSRLLAKRPVQDAWKTETAAMLFEVGLVAVPQDVLEALGHGVALTTAQRAMLGRHPTIGSDLLRHVPRLEEVAEIVRYQAKYFDGSGLPTDAVAGDKIHPGARILSCAIEFCRRVASGLSREGAVTAMAQEAGRFDPSVLQDLAEIELPEDAMESAAVSVRSLRVGHVLDQDIVHSCGTLIVPKGQAITASILARLRSYADLGHIDCKISVLVPAGDAALRH